MIEVSLTKLEEEGINKVIDKNQRFTIIIKDEGVTDKKESDDYVIDKIALLRKQFTGNNE